MRAASDALRLAVGTLTVVPVPPPTRMTPRVAALAMLAAPVAVLPLAVAAALTVWAGGELRLPALVTATLAVAVLAIGSAGLHVDGLADTADGFAVQGDRSRRLDVMRRGDVGPVGAVAVLLVLLLQVGALAGIVAERGATEAAVAMAVGVPASRAVLALACLRGIPAAREGGLGSTVAGTVPRLASVAVVAAVLAVAALIEGWPGAAGVVIATVCAALVVAQSVRKLGGVNGDVLGACVEVALAGYLVTVSSGFVAR